MNNLVFVIPPISMSFCAFVRCILCIICMFIRCPSLKLVYALEQSNFNENWPKFPWTGSLATRLKNVVLTH